MPAYGLTSRCVQNSWLPSSAGCIHRQERKRTHAADAGRSEVAGPSGGFDGVDGVDGDSTGTAVERSCSAFAKRTRSSAVPRSSVLLLVKLDANGFLQRAQSAQLLGCRQGQ